MPIRCKKLLLSGRKLNEDRKDGSDIGDDGNIGIDDFIDFGRIDVDVHDARFRTKLRHDARRPVVKSNACGDDEIGIVHSDVCRVRTVHADHTGKHFKRKRHAAYPHKARHDGKTVSF